MNLLREKLRASGHHVLRCSDAPDMSGMNAAAKASAELGQQAFDFYRGEFEKGAGDRAEAAALAKHQATLQNDLSEQQLQTQAEERGRYKSTFQPLENKIVAAAQGFDTPERREAAATAAGADVEMQMAGQRAATMRAMERSGALPTSGRVAALAGMQDVAVAKAKAGAANQARQQIETLGAAKMNDAAALGRGVVSNSATAAQLGMQAGNSSVANAQQPLAIAAQGAGLMGQGFNTNLAGQGQAGNLYGQVATIQQKNDASNAALWGALGSAAGMAMGKPPV